ncbi:hypothetical protein AN286_05980 [Aliarcobacter cryaerophilus ATCC 43158]|uniref:FAD/FMN-containing dehydrogenase n=1 Tax=Aliarcobacter cryaerophilus ATCC 43158 TaxID=1032070 RepID=A0AAD0TSE6_9BACT|nr:hypothetical protein [Aliarcobacter cryaerophilus]AYJ79712.1 hypothetical protein ACRYA_0572 [Aliarcobacter cryaerophilus ATCC 43158]PRM99643.1 hypothetical protein CJ667_00540 [Aliarcobacter cryaerophilus]QCZ23951.1 hypothetical protein AN286_05980 [Aliarcobacter cryaerophilus ATCC 43158]
MIKKVLLLVIITNFMFAGNLKLGAKVNNFSLVDQFDEIHTITSDIETIIVTFQKETLMMVNDFLSSKSSLFLKEHHAIFINNLSSTPTIITKMFIIPKLRDYKYSILLIYDESNTRFAKQNDKITTYSFENGVVKDIKFISSANELSNLLK